VMSIESIDLLDHVIFVYRTNTGWGSVARSRDPGLHGRRPLFATPRALALSYFESYIDFTGRIKAYAVVDLRVLGNYDWRLSTKNVWKVEQMLLEDDRRKQRRLEAVRGSRADDATETAQGLAANLGVVGQGIEPGLNGVRCSETCDETTLLRFER